MLRFASRVRSVNTSIQPVCCTGSRNHAAKYSTKYESVLVKALKDEAFKALGRANLPDLTQGFRMAADAVVRNLNSRARKISTFEEIAQVGTTAANGDREIGELIAEAFDKGWENDLIIVFDRAALYNELKFVKGMKLDWGIISPYFFTYANKEECVLDNPLVLIHEMKISNLNVIKQSMLLCMRKRRPLLVVAGDIETEVVGHLTTDTVCTEQRVCVVKAGLGEDRRAIMDDLAILTGGQIIATMDNIVFLDGSGDWVDIQERCEQLRSTIGLSTSDNSLKDRLAKLSGGFAVLKVYGHGRPDVREQRLRITNALDAVKAAKEEGIVPGSGFALLYASKELEKLKTTNYGQKIGIQIVQNALKMPAYVIATNAGVDGSVVNKLLEQDNSDLGYDLARGIFTDMFLCGVVDPLKLVRSEFANAVSMISLKSTTLVHGGRACEG